MMMMIMMIMMVIDLLSEDDPNAIEGIAKARTFFKSCEDTGTDLMITTHVCTCYELTEL